MDYKRSNTKRLTEEKTIVKILERVGCLSKNQVLTIMETYMHCTEAKAEYLLRYLDRVNYITVNDEQGIITIGNNTSEVSHTIISEFYVCMDMAKEFNTLKFVHRDPVSGADLSFISEGRLYEIVRLTNDTLSKVNYFQDLYQKNKSAIDNDKNSAGLDYSYTTIFIFSAGVNEDAMLDKLDALDISIPHIIIFLKSDEIGSRPDMNIYDSMACGQPVENE